MSLHDTLTACGARSGERFQLASIAGRADIRCSSFTYPAECDAGDAWAASQAPRDLYLCPNPLAPGVTGSARAGKADIEAVRILLFDLDPEKTPSDPTGTEPGKRGLVARVAETVAAATGAIHVNSGRGRQLWLQVAPDVDREALIRGLRGRYAVDGLKIDSTWPAHQLMRLPGYVNSRTGETAQFVAAGTCVLDAAAVQRLALPVPKDVEPDGEMPPADFGPPNLELLKGRLRTLWDDPKACPDRSTRDAVFVLEALRRGVLETDACRLLFAMPGSKAKDDKRGEGYWQSTVKWARKERAKEEALAATVRAIKSADALLPDSIDALARIQDSDPALYEKTIRRFKKRNVRISRLELNIKKAKKQHPVEATVNLDEIARHAYQEQRSVGWWLKHNSQWIAHPFSQFKTVIDGLGLPTAKVVATLVERSWTLVNEPFQAEELDGRRWNKDAARLTFQPVPGPHPMWDQVLRVVGRGLDGAVARSPWCGEHGIVTGAQYLLHWIASLFQRPTVKLPWLFFYGLENVGKSTFHELLALLLSPGYAIANEALENKNGFNGELAGALICVADDLAVHSKMLKKIKPWVTGERILIHPKGAKPYWVANATHWIQTGNEIRDCPLRKGDTRMTICQVVAAEGADRTSKDDIFARCKTEAPMFTHTALTLKLPPVYERFGLVMLETADKRSQQAANQTALERWLETSYPVCLGLDDVTLTQKFTASLSGRDAYEWDQSRVLRELPSRVCSERRLVRGILGLLAAGKKLRCRVADLLEKLPESRGDWASPEALGIFVGKPGLPFRLKRIRVRGERLLKITLPVLASAPKLGLR